MKLVILYRPNSEHEREVESFVREFQRRYESGSKLELVSLSTRDGAAMASLYDVTMYPAILALAGNGSLANMWQGLPLPLMDDVAGYAYTTQ